MKRIMTVAVSFFVLVGCNHNSVNSQSNESSPENMSSSQAQEIQIISLDKIELAVNEIYSIGSMIVEEFVYQPYIFTSDDSGIYEVDEIGVIKGVKLGTGNLRISLNDQIQNIIIEVKEDSYMNKNVFIDKGRLKYKNVVYIGDSITDGSIRPGFSQYNYDYGYYPDLIAHTAGTSSYNNYAISGATAAFTSSIEATHIFGYNQVKNNISTIANADYVFIMMGTNDFMRAVPLGSIADTEVTTFYGALNTMYTDILSVNSDARIIYINIPYATWGQDIELKNPAAGVTRAEYNICIGEIARKYNFPIINTTDLFNLNNWSTLIPDGIHPAEEGQILLAQRILNII